MLNEAAVNEAAVNTHGRANSSRRKSAAESRKRAAKRPRPRKRHQQQSLLSADGTKAKSKKGGARKGAGRPAKGPRASAPHKKREDFRSDKPLHVVLGVVAGIMTLRCESMYEAIRHATLVAGRLGDIRIVHMSIQWNHIHLIVEAKDKLALARGMKSFEVSAAKRINRALGRRGCVFRDRYHVEILKNPTQTYRAVNYVLNNFRHHDEDKTSVTSRWIVDPYSTGILFGEWKEREGRGPWPLPAGYKPLAVQRARTWLLAVGWQRIAPTISCYSRPGPVFKKR